MQILRWVLHYAERTIHYCFEVARSDLSIPIMPYGMSLAWLGWYLG